MLSGGTWLGVVATGLTVFMLGTELDPPWRWLLPAVFTLALLAAGYLAHRRREPVAAATFLAGAVLTVAPCMLALLAEIGLFSTRPQDVQQLPGPFTNLQVLAASLTALVVSGFAFLRLKMTGFAWTTATLAVSSYLSFLLLFNWLEKKPEVQALWCLPLAAMESAGLALERRGRVRWTLPFHLVALVALVGCLDVIAFNGPTLEMLGVSAQQWPYFDDVRQKALSVVMNGLLYLGLMLATEKSSSLDLRRAGRLLEFLALVHILTALFVNAEVNYHSNHDDPYVHTDVALYLCAAVMFVALAPFRSRWRMLVGGLAGCGLGSYLLVHLKIVARQPFIIGLGVTGLTVALGTFAFLQHRQRLNRRAR